MVRCRYGRKGKEEGWRYGVEESALRWVYDGLGVETDSSKVNDRRLSFDGRSNVLGRNGISQILFLYVLVFE